VIEVEKAIYDAFRVRDVADPELASGDWFSAEVMEMALRGSGVRPRTGGRGGFYGQDAKALFVA
jgi:hypothetical protein